MCIPTFMDIHETAYPVFLKQYTFYQAKRNRWSRGKRKLEKMPSFPKAQRIEDNTWAAHACHDFKHSFPTISIPVPCIHEWMIYCHHYTLFFYFHVWLPLPPPNHTKPQQRSGTRAYHGNVSETFNACMCALHSIYIIPFISTRFIGRRRKSLM